MRLFFLLLTRSEQLEKGGKRSQFDYRRSGRANKSIFGPVFIPLITLRLMNTERISNKQLAVIAASLCQFLNCLSKFLQDARDFLSKVLSQSESAFEATMLLGVTLVAALAKLGFGDTMSTEDIKRTLWSSLSIMSNPNENLCPCKQSLSFAPEAIFREVREIPERVRLFPGAEGPIKFGGEWYPVFDCERQFA